MALILLSDCIKEDAAETFEFFAGQGVEVKIISGDNAATVSSVGIRAGVPGADRCINANTLPQDEKQLTDIVNDYTVFGRVSPEMKQSLVHACQKNGNVVAMVGDGINDVLSLKDADCGIAMANGAPAAKQSAHIVLLDSNFSSMKNIVKEGRTIIANIERVSALYLTKTIYSILLCLLFTIMGRTYPFIPIQLSLIGAAAIGIPSFLLTLEQHTEVTENGFLRHVLHHSLPAALTLTGILLVIQFFGSFLHWSEPLVSTLNLLAGGIISIGVVISVCRPLTRRRTALCIFITLLFAGAILLFPDFFDILPILPSISKKPARRFPPLFR
jgi:cation-transporting ATPase E